METLRKRPEILAPAGSREALEAAVREGADAVYLGLNKFSARAKADNFAPDSFGEALDYAHLFGVKVYVAMNTLVKGGESEEAVAAAKAAWDRGADALIVQDLRFAEKLRAAAPEVVLHASTQLGVHNADGAEVCRKLGFSRVILARETLAEDIRRIRDNVDIEIEAFVQGALCVAFSGNCYLSSLVSGYSGNRGRCMQLCRKSYALSGREGYFLSPKDLCMLSRLDELTEAGVCSLKIEGRMRRPEYVAEAVRVYRAAVEGRGQKGDLNALARVYNRGNYCEGYLTDPTPNLIYPTLQGHMGVKRGVVSRVEGKMAVLSCPLRAGDGVKFLRGGKEAGAAKISRDGTRTGFSGQARPGDEVWVTTDAVANREILSRPTRRLGAELWAKLKTGKPAALTSAFEGLSYRYESDFIVPPAEGRPVTKEEIAENLNKTGETVFFVASCRIDSDENIFLPRSVVNALRRGALQGLRALMLAEYHKNRPIFEGKYSTMSDIVLEYTPPHRFLWVQAESAGQLTQNILSRADAIVANLRAYDSAAMEPFFSLGKPVFLNLPVMARGTDMAALRALASDDRLTGLVVNNLYGLRLRKGRPVVLGPGMNVLGSSDILHFMSIESDEKPGLGEIYYLYGRPPLMTFAHCPHKSLGQTCATCEKGDLTLQDGYGTFPVRRYHVGHCYHQLLHNRPLNRTGIAADRALVDICALTTSEAEAAVTAAAEGTRIEGGTRGNLNKTLY